MIRSPVLLVTVLSIGMGPSAADAQLGFLAGLPLAVEAVPLLGLGVGDFGAADPGPGAGMGYGFDAGLRVGPGSGFSVYGTYQFMRFPCGECEEFGLDPEMVDIGFEGGGRFVLPLPVFGTRPWARAGVVVHQLQFSDEAAAQVSDPGVGYAVGAGADLPLRGPFWLSPSVAFRSYPAKFDFDQFADRTTDVTYGVAAVGLSVRF